MNVPDYNLCVGVLQGHGCAGANENETLGLQSRVRKAMKEINEDPYNFADVIASNDSLIQALQLKKSCNDSLLNSNVLTEADSLNYLDSNNSKTNTLSNAILQNNSIIQQFVDDQAEKIETAYDLNDEISPSTTMETNEKQTNDIYLRYIAAGDFNIEEEDIEILEEIADQCPFSGGRAVYQARAILAIIGGFSEYEDETVCTEDENYRKANKNKKSIYEVTVYPNPLKESCKFIYALPKDENAQLIILDCVGQVFHESDLPVNSILYNLKLKGLSEGVYFYSINAKSGPIGMGKLILIK